MTSPFVRITAVMLMILLASPARSETAEEWVALGTRVHGGFGTFIPVGIRIGEDALQRLGVARRNVTVVYSSGANAPCPCVADGRGETVTPAGIPVAAQPAPTDKVEIEAPELL